MGLTFSEQVAEFHRAMGMPIVDKPTQPSVERYRLRLKLIQEECEELLDAMGSGSLQEIAKEAADLHYVVSGMCLEYGIPEDKVFEIVQASNMSKLWEDGKPRYREDGKVLKPPTYKVPDLSEVMG